LVGRPGVLDVRLIGYVVAAVGLALPLLNLADGLHKLPLTMPSSSPSMPSAQYRFRPPIDLKSILTRLLRVAVLTGPRPELVIGLAEVGS
jgi:hypothetical protein